MLGVVRLSSADKAKKYRALLEEALGHDSLSSRGSSGRVGGRNPVRQSLGTPGRPAAGDGSRHEGQSDEAGSALRNRREALGSAAYRYGRI